jgi:hypothetical protein
MTTDFIQFSQLSLDEKRVLERLRTAGGETAGSVPSAVAAKVTAQEFGAGHLHSTVLTLVNMPLTMRDTEQGGGVKIYTFPLGKIFRLGASAESIVITTTSALTTLNGGVTCNFGVGSTTQASATLATTEQDFVQVTAFTSSATAGVAPAAVRAYGVPNVTLLDGSVTAIDAFFNAAVAGATDIDADASVIVNGVITLNWIRV